MPPPAHLQLCFKISRPLFKAPAPLPHRCQLPLQRVALLAQPCSALQAVLDLLGVGAQLSLQCPPLLLRIHQRHALLRDLGLSAAQGLRKEEGGSCCRRGPLGLSMCAAAAAGDAAPCLEAAAGGGAGSAACQACRFVFCCSLAALSCLNACQGSSQHTCCAACACCWAAASWDSDCVARDSAAASACCSRAACCLAAPRAACSACSLDCASCSCVARGPCAASRAACRPCSTRRQSSASPQPRAAA